MAGELIVNEVLADPPDDANRDGTTDVTDDEFVEIANISSSAIALAGVVVSDGVSIRHRFAAATLQCGQVIVIFGAGNTASPMWQSNWVIASTGTLALNNGGDSISIGRADATPADVSTLAFGTSSNQSLVRQTELLPAAALILHMTHPSSGGRAYSAGTRVDGTAF